ncbi:helix-turn-helix domain-containing protein [Vibrio europaeus]|uniref:helix-turn-helix domain-containing protein n=1 Tax=Vibrio europaeus TaxID=300876 RepID=UPI00233E7411|nr:transcriptional regulator [Vibrio europaeus]MDC5753560.1 transcriptional regulator [Vibrio europaeus]MDC5816528.1 transcriptional regulator [Vibrio europaeus]
MQVQELRTVSEQIETVMPWVNGITTNEQYEELINLMGELVEDYDSNKTLINLLFPVIERYEDEAERFRAFNKSIEDADAGVSMLALIIDQNKLKLDEFPEIGGKSYLSQILNGKKSMTLSHIKALSSRFGIPSYMFL